jgi:hypothetical protein
VAKSVAARFSAMGREERRQAKRAEREQRRLKQRERLLARRAEAERAMLAADDPSAFAVALQAHRTVRGELDKLDRLARDQARQQEPSR